MWLHSFSIMHLQFIHIDVLSSPYFVKYMEMFLFPKVRLCYTWNLAIFFACLLIINLLLYHLLHLDLILSSESLPSIPYGVYLTAFRVLDIQVMSRLSQFWQITKYEPIKHILVQNFMCICTVFL